MSLSTVIGRLELRLALMSVDPEVQQEEREDLDFCEIAARVKIERIADSQFEKLRKLFIKPPCGVDDELEQELRRDLERQGLVPPQIHQGQSPIEGMPLGGSSLWTPFSSDPGTSEGRHTATEIPGGLFD